MFQIDWTAIIIGLALGLALGAAIVVFLAYVVISTARQHLHNSRAASHESWLKTTTYEAERVLVRARAHDPEVTDW